MSDEIGKWYEDQRKKADNIREQIKDKKQNVLECVTIVPNCSHCERLKKEIHSLEKQLEQALYVGD